MAVDLTGWFALIDGQYELIYVSEDYHMTATHRLHFAQNFPEGEPYVIYELTKAEGE